jgi:multidrug transporter EmrE-like cation transporter
MTTPTADAIEYSTPAPKPAPLWEDFIDIFYAPSQVFARRANANPWPMILIVTALLTLITVLTWNTIMPLVEPMTRRAIEKAAAGNPQFTQDMIDTQVRMGMKFAPWASLGTPIVMLIGALVLWILGKLFGSVASYTQNLLIVAYLGITYVVAALVTGAQALVLDVTKLTSPMQLAIGPVRFADAATSSATLFGILMTLDLFTIWRMVLLAVALRELPVGTGYAVWTGTGAVGAAIAGMAIFGESAALNRVLPIGLIAVGIVWLAMSE